MPGARAQPRSGGGLTSVHIWLIVFVVLWLASTVAFIVLFTNQDDLDTMNAQLREDNERLIKPQERDALKAYYTRAEPGRSVVGRSGVLKYWYALSARRPVRTAPMRSVRESMDPFDGRLRGG